MFQRSLSQRIYSDAAYTELVRLVGFKGVSYPLGADATEALNAKYGKDKMMKAADELIEYDTTAKLAMLKQSVRPLCRQLLGPLPEEWNEFYANVDNPPPNPYLVKPTSPVHSNCDDCSTMTGEPPAVEALAQATINREPRHLVPPPEMTAEEMLAKLDDSGLQNLITEIRWGINHYGPNSHDGRQFKRELTKAEAELTRRGSQTDQPSEVDLLRSMHGRKLRSLLLSQHVLLRNYPSGDPTYEEASRRLGLLETEMRKRGQKIPDRPTAPMTNGTGREWRVQNLEGTELMRRYFKTKQVLEEESEHTGVWRQTKIEYDLLRAECERRNITLPPTGFDATAHEFRRHSTHRLKELLDICQIEVGKYGPETVTHQEAARDIGFIEAELRRRDCATSRTLNQPATTSDIR